MADAHGPVKDSSGRPRVMIIEGADGVAELEQPLAASGHFEVEVVEDVLAAMGLLNAFQPHLVLLDVDLPGGVPAVGALESFRAHHPETSVLLISDSDHEADASVDPRVTVLRRPFSNAGLLDQVHSALRLRGADD
ncbi:MAG: response regulator [Candidatus Dormibacteria bacterium]